MSDPGSAERAAVEFFEANQRSPVVFGSVILKNGIVPIGAHYRLKDGSKWRLASEACKRLPDGYPVWDL